jgi:hypothetical protein
METRRFDELTVALSRGGSRRGVLRSLAGGVLGALALGRSGALAKKPIINPAKPICDEASTNPTENCPDCYEARFGPNGCCDPEGREKDCANCDSTGANANCVAINGGLGTCVTAICSRSTQAGTRCEYTRNNALCGTEAFCCSRFTHVNFGHCVTKLADCR